MTTANRIQISETTNRLLRKNKDYEIVLRGTMDIKVGRYINASKTNHSMMALIYAWTMIFSRFIDLSKSSIQTIA